MIENKVPTTWEHWLRHPQRTGLRKALFQVHLWSALGIGLYIFFISVTGSVLVYRNELYIAFTPERIISTASSPRLSDAQLSELAQGAYPGYQVSEISRMNNPDQALEISLQRNNSTRKRFFDPRTGEDLGSAARTGVKLVTLLIEVHKEFLAGPTGRIVNGIAAFGVLLVAMTGFVLWWPGVHRWRRSLSVHQGVGWRRVIWDLHSMVGFWSFAFVMIFALSGIYLCFPESFHAFAERIQPMTPANAGRRFVDTFLYWLAFLHFGRINGIGLPCSGPGLCDQSVKAVWAIFGLAPAVMFVSGVTMWWNRVLRHRLRRRAVTSES